MKNTFFASAVAAMIATTATAETTVASPVLSGEVELTFTQDTTTDNWGGAMGLDLGVDAGGLASVDLDFEATDGNALTLDNWTVGTDINGVGVAMGDDNGVFAGAEGEQTLAAPAMTESVKVTVGDAAVAVGFTDWTTDVTDISNIQGAYTLGNVAGLANITASGDMNLNTDNVVLGAEVSGIDLGGAAISGAVTYDTDAEAIGYEGVADVMGVTAYANGDDTDMLQNVGGEYTYSLGGVDLTAGANYNLDTEDFTPTAGVSFKF